MPNEIAPPPPLRTNSVWQQTRTLLITLLNSSLGGIGKNINLRMTIFTTCHIYTKHHACISKGLFSKPCLHRVLTSNFSSSTSELRRASLGWLVSMVSHVSSSDAKLLVASESCNKNCYIDDTLLSDPWVLTEVFC